MVYLMGYQDDENIYGVRYISQDEMPFGEYKNREAVGISRAFVC